MHQTALQHTKNWNQVTNQGCIMDVATKTNSESESVADASQNQFADGDPRPKDLPYSVAKRKAYSGSDYTL